MEKIKQILGDDITQTALWIGVSAAITAIGSYLLQEPKLVPYYGFINLLLYAIKSINDRNKS